MTPSLVTSRNDRADAGPSGAAAGTGAYLGGGHSGPDRCPGTLEVHQAADGGLARVRLPGGIIARDTLAGLSCWARELGNGRLELTVRGNLQVRGLAPGAEVELSRRLGTAGLLPSVPHDRARNVLASPLSGRDGVGVLDVRPLVTELDRRLCADPDLSALPGRFLFACDDGRGDVAGQRCDVAVLALPDQRVALLVGGVDTTLRLPVRAAVTALLAAAGAFLRQRRDERVWRLSELPDGPLSVLPAVRDALAGAVGDEVGVGPEISVPERDPRGPVGLVHQADGRVAVAGAVPLGELTPSRCQVLTAVAERELVLTPWRGVVLPDLAPTDVQTARRRLVGAGLVLDPDSPALGVSACTARPGCALALADVRAHACAAPAVPAGAAADRARRGADGPVEDGAGPGGRALLPVHWSGCERRCGRPVGPVVDVVAQPSAGGATYRVLRDGESVHHGAELNQVRAAAARARATR